MKRLFKLAAWIFVVWLCIHGYYAFELRAADAGSAKRVLVKIEPGSSVSSIASLLKEKGVIRSPWAFTKYVKKNDLTMQLKSGAYALSPSETVAAIVDALKSGKSAELSVTIPEGSTIADIDALMAEKGLGNPGDIIHCAFTCDFSSFGFLPAMNAMDEESGIGSKLEGFVFPDTYFVNLDYHPKFFLERMLGNFRSRIVDGEASDIFSTKRSLHDIVTMASLIEEETMTDEERPIVAGILWKRLDANTGLGVDATVRYVQQKKKGTITATDLSVDSAYNTRKYRGLPPSPIASPGLASIRAALRPEASEYWYYLHDTHGAIHYAVTNDEHNRNRALYLK